MANLESETIRLDPSDNLVVANTMLRKGTTLVGDGAPIVVRADIPAGHKLAVTTIAAGEPARKYGETIGVATTAIEPGDHIHSHNLAMPAFEGHGVERGTAAAKPSTRTKPTATFQGIVRPDGRVATRNYIGILTSVNCSATTARFIADQFRGPHALDDYPNVDGVVALTHSAGCAFAVGGEGHDILRRTLGGYARHPNFAGFLLVGLGCETNQIPDLVSAQGLELGAMGHTMTIQDEGGTARTVRAGVAAVKEMLEQADRVHREPVPVNHLVLGLECGGSDGYSGLTANPALGVAADLLVAQGGTAVLGETPEIFGAEHLLMRRAVSDDVAKALRARLDWWQRYAAATGAALDNNPSAGNKEGGLTTIIEKSLGAVMKSGSSELAAVYAYADTIRDRGLVFMDTPGYDPVSVTGMVAGGANVVAFTTGRGSVYGCKPAPSIKIASNTAMYERMADDMDLNAGVIADGEATLDDVGERLFDLVLRVASGEKSKSEELGFGDDEFAPWQVGAVL